MNWSWTAALATPLALAAVWLWYQLGDFGEIGVVGRLLQWAARFLIIVALLCPPAAVAALVWLATEEQQRITDLLVEPMLEGIRPFSTTGPEPVGRP